MDQSGNEWLLWRKDGICSTDAPVIMGVSPYRSKLQLFKEKISEGVEETKKYIFELGHRVEKEVRAWYELEMGHEFSAMIFERMDFSFLKASMDGANLELKKGIEIKLVGAVEFDLGICPKRYYPQIQHQYMVTDFDEIDLIMVVKRKGAKLDYKIVKVPKNHEYIKDLVVKEFEFYFENILCKVAPPITELDFIRAPKQLVKYSKEFKTLSKKYQKLQEELRDVTKRIQLIDSLVSCQFEPNGYKSGKMKIRVFEDGVYVY